MSTTEKDDSSAWGRIFDLANGINMQRDWESPSVHMCKSMAMEIVMQCEIIESLRDNNTKSSH